MPPCSGQILERARGRCLRRVEGKLGKRLHPLWKNPEANGGAHIEPAAAPPTHGLVRWLASRIILSSSLVSDLYSLLQLKLAKRNPPLALLQFKPHLCPSLAFSLLCIDPLRFSHFILEQHAPSYVSARRARCKASSPDINPF
jgi:hypothetical protein